MLGPNACATEVCRATPGAPARPACCSLASAQGCPDASLSELPMLVSSSHESIFCGELCDAYPISLKLKNTPMLDEIFEALMCFFSSKKNNVDVEFFSKMNPLISNKLQKEGLRKEGLRKEGDRKESSIWKVPQSLSLSDAGHFPVCGLWRPHLLSVIASPLSPSTSDSWCQLPSSSLGSFFSVPLAHNLGLRPTTPMF